MNKFSSMFGQILHIFSKIEFYSAVKELRAEKGAKGFICWEQFVAMLFCQLGQAHSLKGDMWRPCKLYGEALNISMEKLPLAVPPCPMPMRNAHGRFTRGCFTSCSARAAPLLKGRSSAFRTNS